jgi:hypothetical protein
MRNTPRSDRATRRTFAILTAAASAGSCLLLAQQRADAQTWVNPNTGSWSQGVNWIGGLPPVPTPATVLQFNATGAQTYSAFNDIAPSFTLNTLTTSNSGTGTITVTGQTLGGGAATSGSSVIVNNTGAGPSVVNMGGNVYSLRVQQGLLDISGANYTVASTQRQNDTLAGIDDGRWGVNVGEVTGQTGRFRMAGGNLTGANGMFFGVANGSTGIATFSNNAVVSTGASGRFGINAGTGAISILSGAQITSRLVDIGRQGDPAFPSPGAISASLNIDGANSKITSAQLVLPRFVGSATMTISNGGAWVGQAFDTIAGNTFTASYQSGSANVTVTGAGSAWNIPGTFITSGGAAQSTGDPYGGGTTTFNVNNGGLIKAQSFNFGQNTNGVTNFVADGASTMVTTAGAGAGTGGFFTSGNLGKANVGGPTSVVNLTWQNGAQGNFPGNIVGGIVFTGSETNSGGGQSNMTIQSGASVTANGVFLWNANDDCTGAVTIGNATLTIGGETDFSTGLNTVSTLNLNAGGVMKNTTADSNGFMATDVGSAVTANINGGQLSYTGTMVTTGGSQTQTGDQLESGNATITVSNGGKLLAQFMNFGQNALGRTTLVADGTNSLVSTVGQGAGTGSWVTSNNFGFNGTNSQVSLTFQNGATGSVAADLWGSDGLLNNPTGGISTFTVQSGGKLNVGGFVVLAAGTTDISHMTVTGANSQLTAGTSLLIGGNGSITGGTSSVSVLNGAVANIVSTTAVYQNSTLTVGSGTTPASFTTGSGGLVVDGHVNYNSGTLVSAGTLDVAGTVFLSPRGTGNKKTLDVGAATLSPSGVVDLNDNDMLVRSNQKAYVTQQIRQARNSGTWNMPGITSTAAKNNPQHNTTLGVLSGSEYSAANAGTTQFNGRTFAGTDTLVKYTYYGDSDFNGRVNFDDYVRTDNGFNNHLTGWLNGDYDGNGVVNFDDYVLIDLAFNTQTGTLGRVVDGLRAGPAEGRQIFSSMSRVGGAAQMADPEHMSAADLAFAHAERFGDEYVDRLMTRAVPEPATLSLLAMGAVAGLRRRVRRNRPATRG